MKLGRNKFYIVLFAMCLPVFAVANDVPVLNITDNTNPKIAKLYQRYQTLTEQVSQIQSERTEKLEENYQAMKDKEQSEANRTLTATTTAATGGGTMEAAQGLSEQNADKTAEQSMASYIATMRCKYGNGRQVKAGLDEIELPGGNDEQMMQLRAEYIALANDLKERKEALGMRPGIESEKILDKSQMGLYDDENIGVTNGAYASLYRAQMLGSEKDEQEINATKETAKTRLVAGAATAGAGVVGGIAGNIAINKDAPKESSKQINREYDKKLADVTAEQKDISTKLESAIAENAKAVKEYNNKLNQYKNQIARIEVAPTDCQNLFNSEYLNTISNAKPVENEIDNVPTNIDFSQLSENQASFNECLKCEERGMVFDSGTGKCQCPNDKPIERDGRCMTNAEYECLYEKEGTTWDGTCKCKNAGYTLMFNTCVPDIEFDDDLDDLLVTENFTPRERECRKTTGAIWDAEQEECVCALPNQEIEGDKCVDKKSQVTTNESDTPINNTVIAPVGTPTGLEETQTENNDDNTDAENEPKEGNENKSEYCLPVHDKNGKLLSHGLKSINENTKIGDFCSSVYIASGEVFRRKDGTCSCAASLCNKGYHSQGGQCIVDKDQLPECPRRLYNGVKNLSEQGAALKFCESKSKKTSDICESSKDLQACKKKYVNGCKVTGAIKNYNKVKDSVLCNATQTERDTVKQNATEKAANSKLKYYNCCDTRQVPKDIVCKCVSQFSGDKVTPNEAQGLMKEYALKNHKDDIQCDEKTHRNQDDGNRFRQCASKKNSKWHYEFSFKSLDSGNSGFYSALCSIWGLKSTSHACKNATDAQCKEISAAMNRSIIPGSSAKMNTWNTSIGSLNVSSTKVCEIIEHDKTSSAPELMAWANKTLTKEDLHTISNVNPLYFYDANQQVNANSDVYKVIEHYLFVDQKLPVKQFRCGNGFTDNVNYYNGSRTKFNEQNEKYNKCIQDSTKFSGGGERGQISGGVTSSCQKQYPLNLKTGDLLTCDYNGQKIDFLFRKLDAIWDRKSTGGYQAMLCLNEGGSFTGKSCAVADKNACEKFNKKFLAEYPDSKGMEWDGQTCVLKDTRYVARVRKYAEVAGFGAVTLASAIGGGPIVWVLSGVEAGALVTEAVAEAKLSDWAEEFLVAAAKCNNSSCANSILKKHIARIDKGSKYFSDSQNHQIARQIQRLVEMLDAATISQIIDRGNADGYIGEDRDPELEKALMAYYGTELSSADKNLIRAKKIATVATFATLAGAVTTAGLRVAVKKNWLYIDKARAAKWVDWKILKAEDVSEEVLALTKQGKKISSGADVVSGAVKSWEEELAEIGVKEETASNGVVRYRDIKTGKYISKDEVLKRIDNMPGKNTTPKPDGTKPTATPTTPTPKTSSIENIENKLGDRYKNAKPEIKNNPDKTAVFEKNYLTDAEWETLNKSLAKENLEVVPSGQVMFIRQKRVFPDAISDIRNRVYSEFNTHANNIKSGVESELHIPKAHLSDSEWKMLEADLKKEGLEITEVSDSYYMVSMKKTDTKSVNSARTASVSSVRTNSMVKNTTPNTTKQSSPLYELEDIYEQKLSDDVLTLQQSQEMEQKVKAYDDMVNRAKQTLSPEDYDAFDDMLYMELGRDFETGTDMNTGEKIIKRFPGRYELEHEATQAERNLMNSGESASADLFLKGYDDGITQREAVLDAIRQEHPEAAKFFDNNINTIHDPQRTIFASNKLELQKRIDMTTELSKTVDSETLSQGVQQYKNNIIANFPKDMYLKAKNWQNMSLQQRADFLTELQPFLQRMQGCEGTSCKVVFRPASDIGGTASYGSGYLSISNDQALYFDFNGLMRSLVHENIHLGQESGVRLSKDIVDLSNKNYVKAVAEDMHVNKKLSPIELEAYMTDGMFDNILDEIARYHNW